ncbi:hypothetical protein MtrunA17_Chr2g0298711 [Medicago truncatula]|uniref:Uncharacterized protein n=1 Tax=Medicago truncatula TaxID=3880 RepID=G7IG87_MEDTR|nr:protein CHLOROPLAST IMPORT APPARATUS 2 [Medicago truncatula]AES65325.1 hypothetical protein MTR_2g038010 [Medicago truncatula]RHN73459.1 hypothetical protein MtrunA17_Chr2g0298711 [Medicago truncatula]
MSSSLSGGSNSLNFNVAIKKSSSSTLTSLNSSSNSPSSTLTISEPSNNITQSAIRTKRPRTNRKRPNQTYNEAAELLSKAYPNLFRNLKNLPPPCKFTKAVVTECCGDDFFEPLLLPFDFRGSDYDDVNDFLLERKSDSQTRFSSVCEKEKEEEVSGVVNSDDVVERDSGEEFDCKFILEDEIEEGIDSIIGSTVENYSGNSVGEGGFCYGGGERVNPWFGRFGGKIGVMKALRHVGDVNLLNIAMVDVLEISPGLKKKPAAVISMPAAEKKKQRKKENVEKRNSSLALPLRLKLNYADVRNLWSERGLPFRR